MTGPTMSLGQAVATTGVSTSTLRRRLTAGEIAGAERLPSGGWSIPVAGLIAAGLTPRQTPPDTPPPAPVATDAALTAEVAHLRAEVARLEAIAAERAERITDLRLALEGMTRALPPAPAEVNAAALEPMTEPAPMTPARRLGLPATVRRWRPRRRP